jgi:hypothetical protein
MCKRRGGFNVKTRNGAKNAACSKGGFFVEVTRKSSGDFAVKWLFEIERRKWLNFDNTGWTKIACKFRKKSAWSPKGNFLCM